MKGLSRLFFKIDSCLDGSSNHIPVILTVSCKALTQERRPSLYNKNTDWEAVREIISNELTLHVALKTADEIDKATAEFTMTVQSACWKCTPNILNPKPRKNMISFDMKQLILEKRRLRRVWHTSRHPSDKAALNKAIKELKTSIAKSNDDSMEAYLESLTATSATNYSLWRACKSIDKPSIPKPPIRLHDNLWARTKQEKADAFGKHLARVFTPNEADPQTDDSDIDTILSQPFQLELPIKHVSPKEITRTIAQMNDKKAPGFDLIDKKVLTELPRKAILYLVSLFNGILRTGYFPALWKVSQVIMIPKPGKPPHEITSYRPISLLPIISKLLEKILLTRLLHEINQRSLIPDHQFGFRKQHGTVEQIHRVCKTVRQALERKEYCSSAFLDIQQAFDRVWHKGLLCKIKSLLPSFFTIIESYLTDRIFQIKEDECTSMFHPILAGVPQGSVLGPVLYTLFTSDLPQSDNITAATYADDTAILACSSCPNEASAILQSALNNVDEWLTKWRIKPSAGKSVHVTFTLRRGNCPPVTMRNSQLPQSDSAKYLGMHLDRRLTWRKHMEKKRDEINIKYRGLHWLLGRNSKLSIDNKLLIYKTFLKPVWKYGIELWGSACDSSISIIQRLQNYILKQISNSPWSLKISEVHEHLNIKTIKEEIKSSSSKYKARLAIHPNKLAVQLTIPETKRRLKRRHILEMDS